MKSGFYFVDSSLGYSFPFFFLTFPWQLQGTLYSVQVSLRPLEQRTQKHSVLNTENTPEMGPQSEGPRAVHWVELAEFYIFYVAS